MTIRPEAPADHTAIRDMTAVAFARPEQARPAAEAKLVDDLRSDPGFIPALALVAIDGDGTIVGHVMCTRGLIGEYKVLGLGPLSVRPDRQRSGVGTALVHAVLSGADALGEPLVALLGDPAYYGRFGFRPASEYDIVPSRPWGKYFQVRTLTTYDARIAGQFRYAAPLELMD